MRILLNIPNQGSIHPNIVQNIFYFGVERFLEGHDVILQTTITESFESIKQIFLNMLPEQEADYGLVLDKDYEIGNRGFFDIMRKCSETNNNAIVKVKDTNIQLIPKENNGQIVECPIPVKKL